MKLFAENSGTYIDSFSQEFEENFMDILSRRFRTTRVWCNVVYTELIAEKGHVHMNATQWETLGQFVKYLGKSGKAHVEEGMTPSGQPGLFLKYIIRDAEMLQRQERIKQREEEADNEEERESKRLARQIAKAQKAAGKSDHVQPEAQATELKRAEGESAASLAFSLAAARKPAVAKKPNPTALTAAAREGSIGAASARAAGDSSKRKRSALDEIMDAERKKKAAAETRTRTDWWLQGGIVVKVINKKLKDGKYHKKKGIVERVQDQYVGEVRMLDTHHVLRLDQQMLETVIPKVGGRVRILQGSHRNKDATVRSLNVDKFSVSVTIDEADASETGRGSTVAIELPYEDVSKLA
jgi:DNA/RNA-binding protein KIN17